MSKWGYFMQDNIRPRTAQINGESWGARAHDWADIQEKTVQAVYETVFKKVTLGEGHHYLDAGCGSGLAASLAAERGANVSGVDAATALIEIAKARTVDGEFVVGDIEELPFEDNHFDLVTGFNSFQYAGNPKTALREAGRVCKPDGHILIMTWGEPENMEAASLVAALKPLMPPPPSGAPGPFALSEKSKIQEFATAAGLSPIEILDVQSPWNYPDRETAIRGLMSAGTAKRPIDEHGAKVVHDVFAKALEPFERPDGRIIISAWFRCLLAKK